MEFEKMRYSVFSQIRVLVYGCDVIAGVVDCFRLLVIMFKQLYNTCYRHEETLN